MSTYFLGDGFDVNDTEPIHDTVYIGLGHQTTSHSLNQCRLGVQRYIFSMK